MTQALLTPFDFSNATRIGRHRFRKQILPMREIMYKGRRINFDRPYLQELVRNFKAGAYDQVPFVIADNENRHNENPENFRGSIVGVELTNDGIDAILDLSKDGAKMVMNNPNLGVSARILENPPRSDGRKFGKVLRHVLATMDPRVTGMRPWQAVDLSADEQFEVVDLTSETYPGRKTHMPKGLRLGRVDAKTRTATIDLASLSDDEFEILLTRTDEVEIDPATGKPKVIEPTGDQELPELDPDDFEEDGEEDPDAEDAVVPGTGETPPATPPAGPSSAVKKRKTTVEEEAVDTGAEVASLSNRMDKFEVAARASAWGTKKAEFARKGVPPFMLDLAEPVILSDEVGAIDLANGGSTSAAEVIDKMLTGMEGLIDLTPEMGHSIDLSEVGGDNDPDQAYLDAWSAQYGS